MPLLDGVSAIPGDGLTSLERYHIESGVSVSGSYSALTAKPYDPEDLKIRVKIAGTRRTLGYFIERKVGSACWTDEAARKANQKTSPSGASATS